MRTRTLDDCQHASTATGRPTSYCPRKATWFLVVNGRIHAWSCSRHIGDLQDLLAGGGKLEERGETR